MFKKYLQMIRKLVLMSIVIFISYLSPGQSLLPGDEEQKDWNFVVAPYFWFGGLNGQIAIADIQADVDAGFSDIFSNLKMGFMLYGEVRYHRFGLAVDWLTLNLNMEGTRPISGGVVQVDPDMTFLETSILFSILHNAKWSIDAHAGVRTWWFNAKLETEKLIGDENKVAENSVSWVDPLIGGKAVYLPHKKWPLNLRFDFGGFGAGSDFTWQVYGGAGFRFARSWTVLLNYRALGIDYSQGSEGNADYVKFDAILQGPLLGIMATF